MSEANPASSPRPVQRSSRIALVTRIGLTGTDRQGIAFRVACETIDVNLHGARIRTSVDLQPNSRIGIFLPARKQLRAARVVWAHVTAAGEYGVELEMPEDCWPVPALPEDWKKHSQLAPCSPAPGHKPFSLEIPASGIEVTVSGYTLARTTFREATLFVPSEGNEREALLWVRPLLADGARLQVTFPNKAVIIVRVVGTGTARGRNAQNAVWVELLNGKRLLPGG